MKEHHDCGTFAADDCGRLRGRERAARGQKVRVRFANQIAEPSIVHWHGLDMPESADGHARLAIDHAHEYVYDFEVTNGAGTHWYHPHPHMRTGAQKRIGSVKTARVTDRP